MWFHFQQEFKKGKVCYQLDLVCGCSSASSPAPPFNCREQAVQGSSGVACYVCAFICAVAVRKSHSQGQGRLRPDDIRAGLPSPARRKPLAPCTLCFPSEHLAQLDLHLCLEDSFVLCLSPTRTTSSRSGGTVARLAYTGGIQ